MDRTVKISVGLETEPEKPKGRHPPETGEDWILTPSETKETLRQDSDSDTE